MARNRGKKALYEVMSKARAKPGYGRTLEQLHSKKANENKSVMDRDFVVDGARATTGLWQKPKIVQVVAGRIEFSIPYQIAIALLLVLILVILAVYRLGQFSGSVDTQSASMSLENELQIQQAEVTEQQAIETMQSAIQPPRSTDMGTTQAELVSTGDNVIILTQYHRPVDLVPVKEHFEKYGIHTEIVMKNGVYYLQTKNKYENPGRPGTDGFKARQRIIQVGADYKAPEGFEPFSTHYFSDAYGMKVED